MLSHIPDRANLETKIMSGGERDIVLTAWLVMTHRSIVKRLGWERRQAFVPPLPLQKKGYLIEKFTKTLIAILIRSPLPLVEYPYPPPFRETEAVSNRVGITLP